MKSLQPVVRKVVSSHNRVTYVTYYWGYRVRGESQIHWEGDEDTFENAALMAERYYRKVPATLPPSTVA